MDKFKQTKVCPSRLQDNFVEWIVSANPNYECISISTFLFQYLIVQLMIFGYSVNKQSFHF